MLTWTSDASWWHQSGSTLAQVMVWCVMEHSNCLYLCWLTISSMDFYGTHLTPILPGPWFNIKMSSYQYRKSHCGDKMVVRSSYLHNGISYTGKMASLYWFSPQMCSKYPFEIWGCKIHSTSLRCHCVNWHSWSFHVKQRIRSSNLADTHIDTMWWMVEVNCCH